MYPPPPRKSRRRRWIVAGFAGFFLILIIAAAVGDESDEPERSGITASSTETDEESTTSRSSRVTRPPTRANGSTSSSSASSASSPDSSFGDGTHRVGTDIAPGTYRAPGGEWCRWARLGGSGDDILGFNAPTSVSQIATIKSDDAGFESSGCGQWTRSSPRSSRPSTSFGDGTHIVGEDIAPGTYRAPGGEGCYWARLSGFGGSGDDVLGANAASFISQIVTITSSDAGLESSGCGQWTRSSPRSSRPSTSFGDGTHIVGEDISPGTYRASGGTSCYWVRLRDFSGSGVVDAGFDTDPTVTIESTDAGFESRRCGQWTLQ